MKKMFVFIMALGMYLFCLPMDNFRGVVKANKISSNDNDGTIGIKKNNILRLLTKNVGNDINQIQEILCQNGMALVYGDFLNGFDIIPYNRNN